MASFLNTFWDKARKLFGSTDELNPEVSYVSVKANIHEERDGKHLFVWSEAPFWCVGDSEFCELLKAFEEGQSLQGLLEVHEHWQSKKDEISSNMRLLRAHGILQQKGLGDTKKHDEFAIESISINLTKRCNLRCTFCYNSSGLVKDGSELTAHEMIEFLRLTAPHFGEHPSLVILGGEPFLETEKLLQLTEEGNKLGCSVLVSTNGQLISQELAVKIAALGLEVQVSIDGPKSEHHDGARGKGTFDKACEAVRTLVDAGVHTIISMVCHKGNVDSLAEYFELAKKLKAAEARFIPLRRIGGGKSSDCQSIPMDELMDAAFDLFTQHPEYLALAGRDAFSIMANTCKAALARPSCGTGLQTLVLDADGQIYPCINLALPQFSLGSIKDGDFDFEELWKARENSKLCDIRHSTSLENKDRKCGRCSLRHWCLGGCRGEVWSLTGSLCAPSPDCERLQKAVIEMFWRITENPELLPKSSSWADW